MTGRRVLAIELSPAYVDVAVLRWQNFIGAAAVHEKPAGPLRRLRPAGRVAANLSLPSDETPAKVTVRRLWTLDQGRKPKRGL